MAKITGFKEHERMAAPYREPLDRLADFQEIYTDHDVDHLTTQASRCMDCGVPFCHTGGLIGNMASGCPINNLIPEWNDLIYNDRWQEALDADMAPQVDLDATHISTLEFVDLEDLQAHAAKTDTSS